MMRKTKCVATGVGDTVNIFILDADPHTAARYQCVQHIVKMPTETVQMLVSALLSNGCPPEKMPLAKTTGQPHRGGYPHHPCTVWASESYDNMMWLWEHGLSLCDEFRFRYNKEHAAEVQLQVLGNINWMEYLPLRPQTPFARALNQSVGRNLDLLDATVYDSVEAYRKFYVREKAGFATWNKGRATPTWWKEMIS